VTSRVHRTSGFEEERLKLFTIGDSVSQGFMSAAAARTDLTYSTLVARSMGLEIGTEYRYPEWAKDGLPLNLERAFRRLEERYGFNIRGAEWLTVLQTLNNVVDEAEDYYERGPGAADEAYVDPARGAMGQGGGTEYFHNVAVTGFDVADSWLVTPNKCQEAIANEPGAGESFFLPNAAFYRTALKVLNPSLDPRYDDHSQLGWLEEHANNPDEGVENLILWLGANNALGTVLGLKVSQTPNDPNLRPHLLAHEQREGWTLWHPDDFRAEYAEFLDRVDTAMRRNANPDWNVFVGTVPPVTIAPLAKGVGPTYRITRKNGATGEDETSVYYKYYVYFLFDEDLVHRNDGLYLELKDALHIDDCIREYNSAIRALVEAKNADHRTKRYHIVDIFQMFQDIALKRNAGEVKYDFPEYFDFAYPKVDTRYYHADPDGRLRQGGLSSLDGVHPSAIGHGLLAYEFLKVMGEAGIVDNTQLDWEAIFASDRLYSEPITIMQELYEHTWLAEKLLTLIRTFRRARF
jgi:hypothetical protein